jgi:CheY-like chemotaxis protein
MPSIQITVRDTGIGIAEDMWEAIFEAFTQADASTTRKFGGSGLGLAICRRLCRHMGGDIHVRSELGKGSEFCFHIPMKVVPGQKVVEAPYRGEVAHALRGKTVGVICQNELLRELIRHYLSSAGVDCHGEKDLSSAAMGRLDQAKPQLLIVDTSGHERSRVAAIASALAKCHMPRVFLLSVGNDGDAPSYLHTEDERCAVICKPLRESSLFEGLHEVIQGVSGQRTIHAGEEAGEGVPVPEMKPGSFAEKYPARILVVEDQPMNQKITKMMLEKLGYTADLAENGQEALDLVSRGDYGIILMDLQMPVMGGIEATREIRGNFLLQKQPIIIAMTGHALTGVRESCKEAGMNDFLTKPVGLEELRLSIEECCAQPVPA